MSSFRPFSPLTWYWRADDGRVFSSARQMIVPEDDANYLAFCEGGAPTPWPRDDTGAQTDAALQAVFDSYDLTGMPPIVVPDSQ